MNWILDRQGRLEGGRTAILAVLSLFVVSAVTLLGAIVSPVQALVVSSFEEGAFSSWYLSPGSVAGIVSSYETFSPGAEEASRQWLASDGAASPASDRFSLLSQALALSGPSALSFDARRDVVREFYISGGTVGLPIYERPRGILGVEPVRLDPDTKAVPEPGTATLLMTALLGAGFGIRKRR